MFPEEFVEEHVVTLTSVGEMVLDPFSGRGTTLLQSLLLGRHAAAIDINPVAFCISGAKAHVPSPSSVLAELGRLERRYRAYDKNSLRERRKEAPAFFRRAFFYTTLDQLLFLREVLNWSEAPVHRFIAAMTLGVLHGEMDKSNRYLSNQMPRTISPKPAYSLRYWRDNELWPKKKDVFTRLRSEARFRLSGQPPIAEGAAVLGDARDAVKSLPSLEGKVRAVITSPPYFNVTNFEEDQWLRLWFLGYEPNPTYGKISRDDRYQNKDKYWNFLSEVWEGIGDLLQADAWLVCRLGGTGMEEDELTTGLSESVSRAFPGARLASGPSKTRLRKRQTPTFRPGSVGCRFEVDYVFAI